MTLAVTLVNGLISVNLGDTELASVDIGDHTALGIFFRFQVTDFDVFCLLLVSHICYLSFVGLLIDCLVSVTPNSNFCPPVTSFFGIRSSKRINLSFLRLGL